MECIQKTCAVLKPQEQVLHQVPKAVHRKTVVLIVVVPVCIAVVVVQIPVPGVCCIHSRRNPPVTVVADIVECSIVVSFNK
jgi:hypothetical protein